MTVKDLYLDPIAEQAASKLLYMYPNEIVFVSGRRDRLHQAYAMAGNVYENRRWIEETYKNSLVSEACQRWVDTHPECATVGDLTVGLLSVLNGLSDTDFCGMTLHATGCAFDILPVVGEKGEMVQEFIKTLLGLRRFAVREGGLVRWHCEFTHSSGMGND